jgi:hypothetical protein
VSTPPRLRVGHVARVEESADEFPNDADYVRLIAVAFPLTSASRSSAYAGQVIAAAAETFLRWRRIRRRSSSAGACQEIQHPAAWARRVLGAWRARAEARRAQTGTGGHERRPWPGGGRVGGPGLSPGRARDSTAPAWRGCAVHRLRPAVTLPVWGDLRRSPWRVACMASRPR